MIVEVSKLKVDLSSNQLIQTSDRLPAAPGPATRLAALEAFLNTVRNIFSNLQNKKQQDRRNQPRLKLTQNGWQLLCSQNFALLAVLSYNFKHNLHGIFYIVTDYYTFHLS